jgi:hypothetical protein
MDSFRDWLARRLEEDTDEPLDVLTKLEELDFNYEVPFEVGDYITRAGRIYKVINTYHVVQFAVADAEEALIPYNMIVATVKHGKVHLFLELSYNFEPYKGILPSEIE